MILLELQSDRNSLFAKLDSLTPGLDDSLLSSVHIDGLPGDVKGEEEGRKAANVKYADREKAASSDRDALGVAADGVGDSDERRAERTKGNIANSGDDCLRQNKALKGVLRSIIFGEEGAACRDTIRGWARKVESDEAIKRLGRSTKASQGKVVKKKRRKKTVAATRGAGAGGGGYLEGRGRWIGRDVVEDIWRILLDDG